ncbi:MAG TPA: hypothetical protein VHV08_11545, partial [Pirellulales bacterium]|nr:hypothetical protein [Pirellulales bacterium]
MAHPLQVKIAEVRRQATWLWVLCALGRWLAVMTLCVLAVGLADYWIRFEDRGIRIIASATVVAIFCWATYRFWLLGFERGLKDVQIAQRVERRFPALGDRLASAVAFLKQPDADVRSGSVALRQAVIQDATSAIDRLDLSQVFERRPARRALAVAALCVLAALVVAVAAPQSARLAVARLARPWGNDLWPRFYHVEFRKPPTRLASGQPFEVELVADADHRLPDDVRIHYRYETPTGPTEEESEPMQKLGAAIVARKDHVSRPFWYRAEGGDDRSMDWIRLEVVEPPRVDSLGVTLHPPAYSGLSVETSDKHIRALRGTRVELAGTSTKKLVGARVHQDSGAVIPATISADGYEFSLAADAAEPLIVDKTGPWWIELEDGEGLRGGGDERWEISAVADLAPTISIEQPTANIFVTPEAVVDLAIVAKDDLAIRDVALHFNRSDRTDVEDFAVPLYQGPATVAAVSGGTAALSRLGERQAIEHRWSLAELGAKSGTRVTYWATAGDYLPQSGKSSVRGLTIITKAELEERLAQRQTLILGELQRVLKLEEDARRQTRSLEIQLEQVG